MESFGGDWTNEKLEILRKYLVGYTSVFKDKDFFRLVYVDAFSGSGEVLSKKEGKFIKGSTQIAAEIEDRKFDELLFNDLKEGNCSALEERFKNDERVKISNKDANSFLQNLGSEKDWGSWRGVLFIDPFATQLKWDTLKKIESYNALDTWILFPIMAISRMMPRSKKPEDVNSAWAEKLTHVFGGDSWRDFYKPNPQQNLFGDDDVIMDEGVIGILNLYKNQLRELFGDRFLEKSKTFKNEKNSAIFEFIFCVGSKNKAAITVAQNIAGWIVNWEKKMPGQKLPLDFGE